MSDTAPPLDAPLAVKDVLVVGGGIGGLSAATALSKRGARVTVVERKDRPEGTNIGINYRPVFALHELGILEKALERGQGYPVDEGSRFEDLFDAEGNKLAVSRPPVLPDDWTMPVSSVRFFRPVLSGLMKEAATENGTQLLMGHTYTSIEPVENGVEVELSTGERHTYDLVVGADGVHSGLRERFFPGVDEPHYTGSMSVRVVLENAGPDWRGGRHLPSGGGTPMTTAMYPGNLFYVAGGRDMPRGHLTQDEAREILRSNVARFRGNPMWDEIYERITDDLQLIVTPLEWIFVEPPWNRGRIVLIGDAVHATAPTIGAAGGQALEDGVVLAQELARTADVERALTAFAARRAPRAKLVVETSAALVKSHQEKATQEAEMEMRRRANTVLASAY
jgi:2-polyprenyl-6-methoxyphenol hydroxylase-like FAD-dependent oxidoreductase